MDGWKTSLLSIKLAILVFFLTPHVTSAQKGHLLIPDDIIIQHGGSIGYFSGGVGYEIFRNKKGNIDLLYGHVPAGKGGRLDIITAKFAYRPFSFPIKDLAVFYPANPGAFVSYTFGEDLSLYFDRDQYVKGYYGWSEAVRTHISLSNELEINSKSLFDNEKVKAIVLYSEFNASDLYLISWATNRRAISFFEVFKLGIGARIKF